MKPVLILSAILISSNLWAATWSLDKSHSQVGFEIGHLVISTVEGRFNNFEGTFEYDDTKGELSKLTAQIDVASVDTNDAKRDDHLRGADFFDVAKFPKMEFKAEDKVAIKPNQTKTVKGDLTIHGVTKKVDLKVENKGGVTDPWGNRRVAFVATAQIKRGDFGLTWNKKLDKGGLVVGEEVKILLKGEAVEKKEDARK